MLVVGSCEARTDLSDMTHDCICDWLGLPGEAWPPDHYHLLGLAPGEADAARIEQQVHDRLETVRRYQLLQPEHATEAMNRLAQAFVCLTDPESKRAYDVKLFQPSPAPQIQETIEESPVPESPDPLAWLYRRQQATRAVTQLEIPAFEDGPLLEAPALHEEPILSESPGSELEITERPDLIPPPVRRPPPPDTQKKDIILEAAHTALPPRRVLGTKRAFYHRLARTRELVRAWSEAGDYLGHPGRRLAKPIEATDLIHALITLRAELKSFPPLLGQAGQPGYLVVALARQQVIVPTFQTLLPSQRDALARDWRAGLKLLHAHVQVLREELRAMRHRGLFSRTLRGVHSLLHNHLGLVILFVGFLTVAVAAWRSFRPETIQEPPQDPSEASQQVSVGPVPRSPWKAARPSPRKEPAEVPLKHEPGNTGAEDRESKETVPSDPAPVDEPTVDKKEATEKPRAFQAEDKINCVTSVAFLSKDSFLYCNSHANLHLCNFAKDERQEVNKFPEPLTCVAACPPSGRIACGDDTGRIYLAYEEADVHWKVQALERIHTEPISALAFSADGKRLISGAKDGVVQLWDVEAGKAERRLGQFKKPVRAVALSSDASVAIAGGDDQLVHVWNTTTGDEQEPRQGHSGAVTSLALSRDGRVAFSGGKDGAILGWDIQEPGSAARSASLQAKVTCLALSADGRQLVSGAGDKQIQVWHADQLRMHRALDAANDPVFSLAFSPDGKWILSGQAAGKIVLFPIEPGPASK